MNEGSTYISVVKSKYSIPWLWIILVIILFIVSIVLLILWLIALFSTPTCPLSCTGAYGVQINTASIPLNTCFNNRNQPCIFSMNTLNDAVETCEQLNCTAFTYNSINKIMTIVNPVNTYIANQVTLYIKQNGG